MTLPDLCTINTPPWLAAARACIGQKEDLGPNDSTWLRMMWNHFGASWLHKQPWCGGAMAYWISQAGCAYPKEYYRALKWAEWGIKLADPCVGAVVVFERTGGGHVALVEGVNSAGDLICIGGNQDNEVRLSAFDIRSRRPLAYRWPVEYEAMHKQFNLPLIDLSGPTSTNEV